MVSSPSPPSVLQQLRPGNLNNDTTDGGERDDYEDMIERSKTWSDAEMSGARWKLEL